MYKVGFDKEKYLKIQSEKIMERVDAYDKLYLEVGGKIFGDTHGSRVLPGFEPDIKIRLMEQIKDKLEIVFAISAVDIEENRVQGDDGANYVSHLITMVERLRKHGLYVSSVVITKFTGQKLATRVQGQLKRLDLEVYTHKIIPEYPTNIKLIMSEEGFGQNDFIKTTKPLVIVASPGSGSGKMGTCMSQLYHEFKRGVKAGYSKYEKFPVWNLPLHHPINLAYESATTNIMDQNMIDPFHLDAYGVSAVNYNRDIEAFPVVNSMFKQIFGYTPYKSPTDMGVNMIKECIIDKNACTNAGKQEIIRRHFKLLCEDYLYGGEKKGLKKIASLMNKANVDINDREVVPVAREKAEEVKTTVIALQLPDGTIVTGREKSLLSAPAAVLLNALKHLASIDDDIELIPSALIEPIQNLHTNYLDKESHLLRIEEVMLALSISTATCQTEGRAIAHLKSLANSQAHCTSILGQDVVSTFASLGVSITCEPSHGNAG